MKFLLALTLFFATNIHAQCIQNVNCAAEAPVDPGNIRPAPPITNLSDFPLQFASHFEAEKNYYHCAEGIAIMGAEIVKRVPGFQPSVLGDYVSSRVNQDCTGKIQIYSTSQDDPRLGVCSIFENQITAEINYRLCQTNNIQYWDYLQQLYAQEEQLNNKCSIAPKLVDGKHRGNLWKPTADPKARCKNGTTVLLDAKYSGINQLELLDKSCNKVASAEYFGLYQNSRPRFCFKFPGNKFGEESVYLSFSSQILKVENASKRED